MIDPARLRDLLTRVAATPRHDAHDPLIRQLARLRARDACEYCLHPTTGQFQIDHVIPMTRWQDYIRDRLPVLDLSPGRQGPHHLDNYAWSCPFCNGAKKERYAHGSVRIFDPRRDHWPDHFAFASHYLFIVGLTPIGVATQRLLNFNAGGLDGPLGTRHFSIVAGVYPPIWFPDPPRE